MAGLLERDGRYYAQFYDENRNPPRKRFSLRTKRKRSAQKLFVKFEDDYLEGDFDPWTDDPWSYDEDPYETVTFEEARNRFLERKRSNGRTSNTLRTYREILDLFAGEIGERTVLEKVSEDQAREFIWDSSLADATQRKRFTHLRTFFRWSLQKDILKESPLENLKPPKVTDKLPVAVTRNELEQICDAVREDYKEKERKNWVQEGELIWRIPIFRFAYFTGMRGAEIARLRVGHIDFDRGLIRIEEQKNRKQQTIPLTSQAREILRDLDLGDENEYVFKSPGFEGGKRNPRWFRENVSAAFRDAKEKAGVREELSFHSLRKGFCTALAEAGKSAVVIKEAARHADVSTSMKYVRLAKERLKSEVEDVFS